MTEKRFAAALGIGAPWLVSDTEFNARARPLTNRVDFAAGGRFAAPGVTDEHPVHRTCSRRVRTFNLLDDALSPDGMLATFESSVASMKNEFTTLAALRGVHARLLTCCVLRCPIVGLRKTLSADR